MSGIVSALFGGLNGDPKVENVLFLAPEGAVRFQEAREDRMRQLLSFALPGESVEVTEYNTVRAGDPMTMKLQRHLQELVDPDGAMRRQTRLHYPLLFGVYEEEGQPDRYELVCGLDELSAANEADLDGKAQLQALLRRCRRIPRATAAGGGAQAAPKLAEGD